MISLKLIFCSCGGDFVHTFVLGFSYWSVHSSSQDDRYVLRTWKSLSSAIFTVPTFILKFSWMKSVCSVNILSSTISDNHMAINKIWCNNITLKTYQIILSSLEKLWLLLKFIHTFDVNSRNYFVEHKFFMRNVEFVDFVDLVNAFFDTIKWVNRKCGGFMRYRQLLQINITLTFFVSLMSHDMQIWLHHDDNAT